MGIIGGIIMIGLVAWFWWGKTWDEWDGYDNQYYRDGYDYPED